MHRAFIVLIEHKYLCNNIYQKQLGNYKICQKSSENRMRFLQPQTKVAVRFPVLLSHHKC